jgi:hypothetical protein
MKTNFLENNQVIHCAPTAVIAANEDFFDGAAAALIASDVISLKNADGAVFVFIQNTNAGGNSSIRICACDNNTPTTTVAVSFRYQIIEAPDTIASVGESKALLTSIGADIIYVLEVDAAKVAEEGYEYVYCQSVQVTNAEVDGAMFGFLTGLRYKEDNPGTQMGA